MPIALLLASRGLSEQGKRIGAGHAVALGLVTMPLCLIPSTIISVFAWKVPPVFESDIDEAFLWLIGIGFLVQVLVAVKFLYFTLRITAVSIDKVS